MIRISTVTPVYNGSKYLNRLVKAIDGYRNLLVNNGAPFEIVESIFVLDGPIDNSSEILSKLKEEYSFINILELSQNFGQHPATIAGILHTSGDWIATLDEDLQHEPKYISDFLKKAVSDSYDICYARNPKSTHRSFIRDRLSILYKKLISSLSANKNVKHFNSYRLIRGDLGRAAASVFSFDSYLDICLCWFTNRICTIEIPLSDNRNYKERGKSSGYSLLALIQHAKRLLMSTKVKLLRIVFLVSFLSFVASIFLIVYFLFNIVSHGIEVKGWASIITVILVFGGISSLLQGFLSEGVTDILLKSKGKPPFFVIDRSKDKELKEYFSKG